MRKLANHAARDIASPAVKMGNRSLFPGVAVPLAFFCTLFFRHRKKSVSAPWDGKSLSAPESARQSPAMGIYLRQSCRLQLQAGGIPLAPCTPSDRSRRKNSQGLSSGQTIGAVRTAVRPACCLPELRVANRLRRLYTLDDGELFKFNLKSSVCQRQTGLSHGQPALCLPLAALHPGLRAFGRAGCSGDMTVGRGFTAARRRASRLAGLVMFPAGFTIRWAIQWAMLRTRNCALAHGEWASRQFLKYRRGVPKGPTARLGKSGIRILAANGYFLTALCAGNHGSRAKPLSGAWGRKPPHRPRSNKRRFHF